MAAIKSIQQIAEKWRTVTPMRSADYEEGIKNPQKDWAANTIAAQESYKAGVQAAIAEGRFVKGVTKAGNAAWQEGALTKGVTRWGAGVALAGEKYAEGYAPYQAAIARLTLPPRYAKRDPRNLERVKAVVNAMIAVKMAK